MKHPTHQRNQQTIDNYHLFIHSQSQILHRKEPQKFSVTQKNWHGIHVFVLPHFQYIFVPKSAKITIFMGFVHIKGAFGL
jgi:hypothetical protein